MPRYFFDLDDGIKLDHDEEGIELSSDQAATDEASRTLREMAREYVPRGTSQKNLIMWVRKEDGTPLLSVTLAFAIRPAI